MAAPFDADRRNQIVPAPRVQVFDVVIEARGASFELAVLKDLTVALPNSRIDVILSFIPSGMWRTPSPASMQKNSPWNLVSL